MTTGSTVAVRGARRADLDLTPEDRATLGRIWRNEANVHDLRAPARRAMIDRYREVGRANPAGSAQHLFQEARADYLEGTGPNPGPSVNDFAAATGCVKAIKSGERCNV